MLKRKALGENLVASSTSWQTKDSQLTNCTLQTHAVFFFFFFVLELSMMFLVVVLDLSTMFLVGSIDNVAAPMFPNKQIHADPEGCSTIAELFPLK